MKQTAGIMCLSIAALVSCEMGAWQLHGLRNRVPSGIMPTTNADQITADLLAFVQRSHQASA